MTLKKEAVKNGEILLGCDNVEFERKEKKNNAAVLCLIEYASYFAAFMLLINAKTSGLSPFAFGFFSALAVVGKNIFFLTPAFAVAALITTWEFSVTIQALMTSITTSAVVFAAKRMNKKPVLWLTLLFSALGQASGLYFVLTEKTGVLAFLIELLLSPMFAYVCICALKPFSEGSGKCRPTATALACGSLLLAALFCGSAPIAPFGIKLLYVLTALIMGLGRVALGKGAAIVCAISGGIGSALSSYNVTDIAFFAITGCVFAAFSDAPRPVAISAALMGAVCFTLYLNVPYQVLGFDLIALSIGGSVYCLLPKRALRIIGDFFLVNDGSAVRSLINGGREAAAEEMLKTGNVFAEMSRTLKQRTEIMLGVDGVREKLICVCSDCNACDKKALDDLINVTVQNGRASVNEVAELIKCDCPRAARLISVADEEIKRLRGRIAGEEERAARRRELALQLDCVCEVLRERAKITSTPLIHDPTGENALLDELFYHSVPAIEVAVQKGEAERIMVVLASAPDDGGRKVADVAGKVFRSAYAVESIRQAGCGERVIIALREKTAFDVVFASANVSKSDKATGDTHSFIRVSDTKFMMALCDGMGSGESAGHISETAIDLVECFFRAGFDGKFALESVNRFLAMDEEESFAAFDVLVCDLNSLERVIIKMGSPASFIKNDGGVARIDGAALPLGAIRELTPFICSEMAQEGETIVFVSDGVTDALGDDGVASVVAESSSRSVKRLCDDIICAAKSASKQICDDMTAIAARIIKRI